MRGGAAFALFVGCVAACATVGPEGTPDPVLPNAGVGPFRKLAPEELKGLAPFVLDDAAARYRDPAVLGDGDETLLFAAATVAGRDVIVRTRALDARTFFGSGSDFGHLPAVVLEPDAPWEGGALAGPTVLQRAGEVLLYYGARDGIGLARSADGRTFAKAGATPVLAADSAPGTWEVAPPSAPAVYVLPDGRLRMLYGSGAGIGEAESADGVSWTRLGLVLGPAPPAEPGSLLPFEKPPFDTASVGDPCVVPRTTPAGRYHVRVLYTGKNPDGTSAIGFAARYGTDGPLHRQSTPLYSVGLHEAAPAMLDLGSSAYLYVQQDRLDGSSDPAYLAIAAAFSPGTAKLPPAGDYPDGP